MTRIVKGILLVASVVGSADAWGVHSSGGRPPSSRLHGVSAESGKMNSIIRRDLLLAVGGIAVGACLLPGAAQADGDPFAEIDEIAKKIQDSSQYPNSISPLPTYKATEKELVSDAVEDTKPKPGDKSSDMAQALQDIQNKKRIDPRTHG